MAEKKSIDDLAPTVAQDDIVYMPLQQFADTHALKYGVELMGGFFHEQEHARKFADTEDNWHKAINAFAKREVK